MTEQEPNTIHSIHDGIRSHEDVERLLASASNELMGLALVGKMFSLSSPDTDQQLNQIAANITGAAQNLERAKTLGATAQRRH